MILKKQRYAITAVIVNLILFVVKLFLGIIGKSQALIADSFDTLSDTVGDIIIFLGFRYSEKPPDEEHPYGHGKIESIVVGVVGLLIFVALIGIIIKAVKTIIAEENEVPKGVALLGAVLSIVVKFYLYQYFKKRARWLSSPSLMAGAEHAKSDMLSSVASSSGIAFSILGYRIFDPIAAIIITIMISRTAFNLLKLSFTELTDRSIQPALKKEILEYVNSFDDVKGAHLLRSRISGGKIELDIHIQVNPLLPIDEAHSIAHKIKRAVLAKFPLVKEFLIHIEPQKDGALEKEDVERKIREALARVPDIKFFHGLIIANTEKGMVVCLDIEVPENLAVKEAHRLSQKVRDIVKSIVSCKDVVVHIDVEGSDEID